MSNVVENSDPFKNVCSALRSSGLLDEYEEAFKEQEMTDDLVQDCMEDNPAVLGQIILKLGLRLRFEREFKNLIDGNHLLVTHTGQPVHPATGTPGRDDGTVDHDERANQKRGWIPVYPVETSAEDQLTFVTNQPEPPPPYSNDSIPDVRTTRVESSAIQPQPNSHGPCDQNETEIQFRSGTTRSEAQHGQSAQAQIEPEAQLTNQTLNLPPPQALPQPALDPNVNPWKRIAQLLNLRVNSKHSILKQVISKALEMYQNHTDTYFQHPTDCVPEEQVQKIQSEAADKAYCYLEEILEGVDSISSQLAVKNLDEELERRAEVLTLKNNNQTMVCNKTLEEAANGIYKRLVQSIREEVLLNSMTPDKFEKLFTNLQKIFQEEFQAKWSNLPLFCADVLNSKIAQRRGTSWKEVEQLRREYQRQREEIVSKACRLYEDAIRAAPPARNFQDVHEDSRKFAIKSVHDSVMDADIEFQEILMTSAPVDFEKLCVDLKLKAEKDRATRAAAVDQALQNLCKDAVIMYIKKMVAVAGSIGPVNEVELSSAHIISEDQVVEMVSAKYKNIVNSCNQDEHQRHELMEHVHDALAEQYAIIAAENGERWRSLEERAKAELQKLKAEYSAEILKLAESCSVKTFESAEENLREQVAQKLVQVVGSDSKIPPILENLQADLAEFCDTEKQGALDVFGIKQWEDEVAVKSAMLEAKRYYINDMESRIKSKEWFEEDELMELHEILLQRALATCADITALNPRQEDLLRESFSTMYKRYSDENRCRIPNTEPAIGIDLGTTNCCVAVYIQDRVHIIPNLDYVEDKRVVPSFVSFNDDYTIDVGHVAKERAYRNVQNTVFNAKRLIGRKFDDEVLELDRKLLPFDVIDRDNEPRIFARGKEYRPEEISAKILFKLKLMAETYLNRQVKRAVITVPAYFTEPQRQATKHAAVIAGLESYIMNEPTAAALAYKLNTTGDLRKNVLVFDLGGGTFDVVVIQIEMGKINVLAIGGDTHLGGEDFDHNMVEEILRRVKTKHGIDLMEGHTSRTDKLKVSGTLRRLRHVCEQGKRNLATSNTTKITLEDFDHRLVFLQERFTREDFNQLNQHLFEKCIEILGSTLKGAKLSKDEIDDIVLVGGSTRIPKIQQMLTSYFGENKHLTKRIDPDEAVAFGAAYEAAIRFSSIPKDQREPQGIQDVTPRSMGIKTFPDQMSVVIPKNTKTPCSIKKGGYMTRKDNQTLFSIAIYEGESRTVRENVFLGKFILTGIPPAPAGHELMECTMSINNEGILQVTARLVTNGKFGNITIETQNGRMSEEELKVAQDQNLLRWTPV